jgi:Sec-independent protein translocase protein TatA
MSGIGGGEIIMVLFILFCVLSPADFKAALRFLGRLHTKYHHLMEEYLDHDILHENTEEHSVKKNGETTDLKKNTADKTFQNKNAEK